MNCNTKELAKKMNLLELIRVENNSDVYNVQPFEYLFVLDFEATCWDRNEIKYPPEIIEFSVVLYHIKSRKIVDEFQQHVMPLENQKLSLFCTKLTGITQKQVDDGVPLKTCLMLFMNWINEQIKKYNLNFNLSGGKYCTFVTWTDWDLATCLRNECKRKLVKKPEIFNKWINIKAIYQEYYKRCPSGLNGALNDVGLKFVGIQHCGLDDARNTAYLVGKMISDGTLLRITKEI